MPNYFDNQSKWSWNVSEKSVQVTTDHGSHTHTLDVTNVPIGEMVDSTGKVMGDAHRAASHDFKETNEMTGPETETTVGTETENTVGVNDSAGIAADSDSIDDGNIEEGEECEDELDL